MSSTPLSGSSSRKQSHYNERQLREMKYMEQTSFYKLISEACVTTFAKKLPWIFGSFVAISALIESKTNEGITNASSLEELFQTVSQKSPKELFIVFVVLFALFVLGSFGKGNLIASLSFLTNKNDLPNHPTTLRALSKNFVSTFFLECIAFLFLVALIGIFSLPVLIASGTNPGAVPILLDFAILTFIPIAFIVSLIKEFSFIYVLLSPLKIRGAIEASRILFSRNKARSFFFALLALLLTGLFTFCINLVILGITALSEKISLLGAKESISLFVSLILFTWFTIFLQALWIIFFKSIARVKTDPIVEEKAPVEGNIIPEIPPV